MRDLKAHFAGMFRETQGNSGTPSKFLKGLQMSRRRKPHDPASATQAMIQRREREEEKRRLEQMGATVTTDPAGRIVSAYRSNVFNLLLKRGRINLTQFTYAAELCELWAQWKGLDGKPEGAGEFVDNGRAEPDKRQVVTDRMLQAGRRTTTILANLEPINCVLLERLIGDTVEHDRPRPWRLQVQQAIGVTIRDRQPEAVLRALEDLVSVCQTRVERRAA